MTENATPTHGDDNQGKVLPLSLLGSCPIRAPIQDASAATEVKEERGWVLPDEESGRWVLLLFETDDEDDNHADKTS
jgi:hypothetical protein